MLILLRLLSENVICHTEWQACVGEWPWWVLVRMGHLALDLDRFFPVFWCVEDLCSRKLMKKPWTLVTHLRNGKLQEEESGYSLERKIRASEVILKHYEEIFKCELINFVI